MTKNPLVRVDCATKTYRSLKALDCASLTIPEHAYSLLVGLNGAGKSTLLNALSGLVRLDSGSAQIAGVPVNDADAAAFVARQLEYPIAGSMTVAELSRVLRFNIEQSERFDAMADGFGLEAGARLTAISRGTYMQAMLCVALSQRRRLLLLDEPTVGLDADARETLLALLAQEHAKGVSLLIATHDASWLGRSPDWLVTMVNGRVTNAAPPSDAQNEWLGQGSPGLSKLLAAADDKT